MATAHPSGNDPRKAPPEADVRPVVAQTPRSLPWWIVASGFAMAAILLFTVLDSRRRALTAPATKVRASDAYSRAAAAPPVLLVPPAPAPPPLVTITPNTLLPAPVPPTPRDPTPPRFYPPPTPPVTYPPPVDVPPPTPQRPTASGGAALVIDTTVAEASVASASGSGASGGAGGNSSLTGDRARATTLRQRSTTVPQGALIAAVLETALDSTRPGLARALVQRDVVGFDGSRVLIPRGSRLIGEYRAGLLSGQKRLAVNWTRLVRPDGVSIALNSPAADTLGRSGVTGDVNSHFFERFGGAILQSALDVGVNLASRLGNNNNSVVVGLPLTGATQGLIAGNNQVQPTLTVKQGTAIMVFVARDLDFTGVERSR